MKRESAATAAVTISAGTMTKTASLPGPTPQARKTTISLSA